MTQSRFTKENTKSITNSGEFTRAVNKHTNPDAPIPSLEGKQKFQVYGEGILKDTWIYIYPHEVAAKRKKYKGRKQWLFGPLPQ